MNILINNEIANFTHDDFPMLISGVEKSGTSFFSVCLMTELFNRGEKEIFFTAYPPAKEEFRKQLGDRINDDVQIIDFGDEDIFLKEIEEIGDLDEKIILVKNIENYSENLFDKLKDKKLVIFSGDMDKCQFGDSLAKKDFKTKIFFSYPEKVKVENKIELTKYEGVIISKRYNGLINLDK
jgi:hypothetical protein